MRKLIRLFGICSHIKTIPKSLNSAFTFIKLSLFLRNIHTTRYKISFATKRSLGSWEKYINSIINLLAFHIYGVVMLCITFNRRVKTNLVKKRWMSKRRMNIKWTCWIEINLLLVFFSCFLPPFLMFMRYKPRLYHLIFFITSQQ